MENLIQELDFDAEAKFYHFGKIIKVFLAIFKKFYLKIWIYFDKILCHLEKFHCCNFTTLAKLLKFFGHF